ncbi:MAG: type II toxin-antitoxin system VapC family toxin [Alphaproteobacteria bacterium]
MPGANPTYYWDTCLFIAWLQSEDRKTGEMDGVREMIQRHRRREIKIMTSVLTQVEVLQGKIPAGVGNAFTDFLKRITRVGMDIKVAQLAHDLRDHYSRAGGKPLTTPDAIHLATAIHYRADEFHTFDEGGKSKSLGLIQLSGNVGGHRLTICKPEARSPQLDLRKS